MQVDNSSADACGACPMTVCKERRKPSESTLNGWRFAGVSAGVFLLPLGLAISGALLAGGGSARSFVGAVVGLGGGMAISISVSWFVRSKSEGTRS